MSETIHFEKSEYRAYEKLAKEAGFKTVDELVAEATEHFVKYYLIDREEVTVKVPSKLLRMVKDSEGKNWLTYLNDSLTDSLHAAIHAEEFGKMDQIIEKYGLAKEFRFYQGH